MGRRGQFKWKCLDCKAETFFERRELIRAARPKCSACGSVAIEPVTREAKQRLAVADIVHREQVEEIERKGGRSR